MSGEVCGADNPAISETICPVCRRPGRMVSPKTVASLLKSSRLPESLDGYSLCLSHDCDVVYYGSQVFGKEDVRVKVWYKENDPSVPVCYCRNVTEADVVRHIAVVRCCDSLKDIQKHTGANTGKECLTQNPGGT